MASKSGQEALSTKELEELLDTVDKTLDRLKTMYEQYFLGIQKQAPAHLHTDVERKLRDLTQLNMRNTSLRYRLATLQQKFGSYNSYWRRTLRQIENGTYLRNLAKIGREAARTGGDIPEEILAAMPKRMREQVLRDRDQAIAIAKRRQQIADEEMGVLPPALDDDDVAAISEPSVLRREMKTSGGAHVLAEDDADLDFDSFFAAFQDDAPAAPSNPQSTQAITRPIPRVAPQTPPPSIADFDPPTVQPTTALPRMTPPSTQPTTALPRVAPPHAQTSAIPRPPTGPTPVIPSTTQTGPVPVIPPQTQTSALPRVPAPGQTTGLPKVPPPGTSALPKVPAPGDPRQTGPVPRVPGDPAAAARQTGPVPRVPAPGAPQTQPIPRAAPSQQSRPNPVAPGASTQTGPVPVESMNGPFPRAPQTQPLPKAPPVAARPTPPGTPPPQAGRPTPRAGTPAPGPQKPPPGMTEADVNALHAKYVQAKQMVGEKVDAASREKLLRTINQTAPKIMEQYKASGVDFSVVVKDNQVVIKAKPKT